MGSSVLYMSMTLDGFIAGPNVRPDNGLGDGGERLHEWVFGKGAAGPDVTVNVTGNNRIVFDEMMSTGAVVAGRGTFEPAGGWNGDHHDGIEIFILSRHEAPDWVRKWRNVHYVPSIETAMREAKRAAGDRNVMVHGSGIVRHAMPAGLLDEVEIHLVPVLFGEGTPLFGGLGAMQRELERVRVLEGDGVTHLHYRVRK